MATAGVETPVDQYASFRNAIPALADAKVKGDAATKEWYWAMDFMCKGHMLADSVAILGSMDVVFGEIDR